MSTFELEWLRALFPRTLALALVLGACDDDSLPSPREDESIVFPSVGSLSGASGHGSFRFGAATAATQIEDQNPNTDWYVFTAPAASGGLGRGKAFVGDAVRGYSMALPDVDLLRDLHVDSYRFSIEWGRVEPKRDQIDEIALLHYRELLERLAASGIRPNVTIHHFSNPIWIDDPRDTGCARGPSDANLCGLGHPVGGPLVIEEARQHARLLAARFGDRVDDWATVNEPINYLLAAYGIGQFPPGEQKLSRLLDEFMPIARDYFAMHAAMAAAIHEADTIDADGDGIAANVGATLNVADWVAAKNNAESTDPADVRARDRLVYVYHHLFVDSLRNGTFDFDLDGTADESHPEWRGSLDWLGVQYYSRMGVTGSSALVIPVVDLLPCFGGIDQGACVPPIDPTYCVPQMGYEHYPQGLYTVLADLGSRYPDLPLVVSESGIATDVGERRAENVVRALEQIERARRSGIDVRGYYHWSLLDNFEWAQGFGPHFGLYRVDYETYRRHPTRGAEILAAITKDRRLSAELRKRYGGGGPLTPDSPGADRFCHAE